MAEAFTICGSTVEAGQELQINLDIARLPTRTPIEMPLTVSRGLGAGPVLLLLAGMHGDEINGIEILRRMLREGYLRPECGTVICIPVVNIYGFINFSRDVPDGKDVNRSFPGSESGSLAGRIAHRLVTDILPHIDYGIDFHTGGASRSNFPQIRCRLDDPLNRSLARAFAPPFIMHAALRNKSLRQSATTLGKRILVYEGGESLRFDEFAIAEGIAGARRVMKHLGMVSSAPAPTRDTTVIAKTSWVRARNAGLFHAVVNAGEAIRRHQVIGALTDPFGDFQTLIKAQQKGYVLGVNNNPVVHQGDALLHIGYAEK